MTTITPVRDDLVHELPEAGLAARLWLPLVAFVTLLAAIAGVCLVYLDLPVAPGVPESVLDAERRQVDLLAGAAAGSAVADAGDLRAVVIRSAGTPPQQLVSEVVDGPGRWQGAVLTTAGDQVVASSGDAVPLVRPPTGPAGDGPMVVAVPQLDGPPLLVTVVSIGADLLRASSPIALPPQSPAGTPRWLWLTDGDQITPVTGNPTAPTGPAGQGLTDLVAQAASRPSLGQLVGPTDATGTATVTTYAPVANDRLPGGVGLSLVTAIRTQVAPGAPGGQGTPAAVALLLLAIAGAVAIRRTVVAPVRRLREAALTLASGNLSQAPPSSTIREVAVIAGAFEYCRARLAGRPPVPPSRPRGQPASLGVTLAALGVVSWSVLVVVLAPVYLGPATVPGPVVTDAQERVQVVADRAAGILNEGAADLRRLVTVAGADRAALDAALDQTLATSGRFRGVRLVDGAGQTQRSFGQPLLRGVGTDQDGLSLAAAVNPAVPVPVAQVSRGDGTAVIAEFDVGRLASILAMSSVRTRLLDGQFRTVTDTEGFVAFATLPDGPRRELAAQALRSRTAAARVDDDAVLAATPVTGGGAGALGWVVLADEPVLALPLSPVELERRVTALAVPAASVAIVVWAVYYLWHIRPLRRGARMATALRDGDVDAVIYPQYQGAVGTIIRCLDTCRRAVIDGPQRLGPRRGAPRTGPSPERRD